MTSRCRSPCSRRVGVRDAAAHARKQGPSRPVSRATEVIATPSRPHGTIHSNGSRLLSTLTAKPCVAIPRRTCTPIEAILRAPSTQTPVKSGPSSARPARADALLGERGGDHPLHRAHVGERRRGRARSGSRRAGRGRGRSRGRRGRPRRSRCRARRTSRRDIGSSPAAVRRPRVYTGSCSSSSSVSGTSSRSRASRTRSCSASPCA